MSSRKVSSAKLGSRNSGCAVSRKKEGKKRRKRSDDSLRDYGAPYVDQYTYYEHVLCILFRRMERERKGQNFSAKE